VETSEGDLDGCVLILAEIWLDVDLFRAHADALAAFDTECRRSVLAPVVSSRL
jgi:hypothetical protein